ncbi:MAG: PT domain-containing protein [Clostridia bacterium]|nr:PT domain-containing protein [Clostridia bacterium]
MKDKKHIFLRIVCIVMAVSLTGIVWTFANGSGEQETLSQILNQMSVLSAYDFNTDTAGTAIADTDFADDWSILLAGGGTAAVAEDTAGKYAKFDKYSAVELKNMYFGPSESYAVSYRGKFGERGHNYLFVRGTQVLKRNGTVMNWYESDGSGAGSGVGGSGIYFRVYNDDQIQVSVKSYDAEKGKHVATNAVLLSVYPEGEGTLTTAFHTYTCYDDGNGTIVFYIDGVQKATITYSGITTYTADNYETVSADTSNPIHASYYKDVVVKDAAGETKLSVSNALVAVQGRVAFGHRNVTNTYYDEIKVYVKDLKIDLSGTSKYGNGNLGLLTGNESSKRCFPEKDTFVYFRNSGGMALNLGTVDLSKYDRVSITWWDAAYGNARTLAAGSVNFAITSTGALDTTTDKQVEQSGVNKLAFWSLATAKNISAKEDFRSAETITLSLNSTYSGPVYLAYMGTTNAVAVSQVTFHEKAAEPTPSATPTNTPSAAATESPTESPTATPESTPTQAPSGNNPGTGEIGLGLCAMILLFTAGAFIVLQYRKTQDQ